MSTPNNQQRKNWPYYLVLLAALTIAAAHAVFFSGWMIDDSGISFAYARNLVNGDGLVPQPNRDRVEGFSNPLWTLLIAVSYATGTFSLDLTPKLVAFAMLAVVFYVIWRDLRSRGASPFVVGISLVVLAACTPFIIWTTSGLENALLAMLVVLACANTIRATSIPDAPLRTDVIAGVLAGLMALTRPDAIMYAAVHPAVVFLAQLRTRQWDVRGLVRRSAAVVCGFVPIFASYMAFRVMYFGSIVPNTYYAKQKPSIMGLLSPGKLFDLIESATGDLAWVVPFCILGAVGAILLARRYENRTVALFGYLSVATAIYLLMPPDWMGEFRFATAFFPLFYWTMAELSVHITQAWSVPRLTRMASAAVMVIFTAQMLVVFASRSVSFNENPPVPLKVIQRFGAAGFDHLGGLVPVDRPSVLTPDLGGMLLDSNLVVFDLAGLCDKTIARSISITGDPTTLHNYVFGDIKPTFMHVIGAFTRLSRFHTDPRFARDYVPLHESWDGPPEWATMWQQQGDYVPPFFGDYVRRDALGSDPAKLAELQRAYRSLRMETSSGVWRLRREGFVGSRPLVTAAARNLYRYYTASSLPSQPSQVDTDDIR